MLQKGLLKYSEYAISSFEKGCEEGTTETALFLTFDLNQSNDKESRIYSLSKFHYGRQSVIFPSIGLIVITEPTCSMP